MEYASRGVGNAALTTGIIGTALGVVDGMGGLAGLFGDRRAPLAPEDKPVSRYELGLVRESIGKDNEITLLKAQQYTDQVNAGIQAQIAGQNAWNAAQAVNIQNMQNLLNKLVQPCIPNAALNPGYGQAVVFPAFPPAPPVQTAPATTSAQSTTNG